MTKILVVVDMQNDFINGSLGTKEAVNIVDNVVKKIEGFDGRVLYTRDTHLEDYLETQEGKNLPVKHCIENTHGWEIEDTIKSLAKENNSTIFDKLTFGSKDLVNELVKLSEKEEIEEIQIVGLCTDICVISNALTIKTFLPEISIVVDASCCAGVTEASHLNALNAMKMCQIEII